MPSPKSILLSPVIILLIFAGGCQKKSVRISPPQINAEAAGYIAKGDALFRENHLYSWRKAEDFYQKAIAISPSPELRKKFLLTRFLILIRQIDEDILYPAEEETMKELCAGDQYQKNLCGIAEWIRKGKKAGQLKLNGSIFSGSHPDIDSYLNLIIFQAAPQFDAFTAIGDAAAPNESPLFLYLNSWEMTSKKTMEFEKSYPQYAEGFQHIAVYLSQKKHYRSAKTFYEKAIELIPEYSNAFIGIGDIYLYGFEDYLQAAKYYDQAIKQNYLSSAAMLGKAIVLQQLGKYQESNAVLDHMLDINALPKGANDRNPDALYYEGQGNYLKAYNYYLLKDSGTARELVDKARKALPDVPDSIYLSGLLHYEAKELELARKDFIPIAGSSNCNASYYLGLIHEQFVETNSNSVLTGNKADRGKGSIQYFHDAGSCLEGAVGTLSYQIKTLNLSDLEPNEQVLFKSRMEKKLADTRTSASSTLEQIVDRVSRSSAPEKEITIKSLNGILSRIRGK